MFFRIKISQMVQAPPLWRSSWYFPLVRYPRTCRNRRDSCLSLELVNLVIRSRISSRTWIKTLGDVVWDQRVPTNQCKKQKKQTPLLSYWSYSGCPPKSVSLHQRKKTPTELQCIKTNESLTDLNNEMQWRCNIVSYR